MARKQSVPGPPSRISSADARCDGPGAYERVNASHPVVLGLATIVLLMKWVDLRFGRRASFITGALVAVSPYQIRYSQELRPYPYLLFFFLLSLVLIDHLLLGKGGRGLILAVAGALAGGLYCHEIFPVIFGVILATCWTWRDKANASSYRHLAAAVALALLAYLPLLPRLLGLLATGGESSARTWGWWLLSRRWEFLTCAGREGFPLSLGGVAFFVMCAIGIVYAAKSSPLVGSMSYREQW